MIKQTFVCTENDKRTKDTQIVSSNLIEKRHPARLPLIHFHQTAWGKKSKWEEEITKILMLRSSVLMFPLLHSTIRYHWLSSCWWLRYISINKNQLKSWIKHNLLWISKCITSCGISKKYFVIYIFIYIYETFSLLIQHFLIFLLN